MKLKNAAPKEEKPSVEDSTSTTSARNVLKTASASKRSSARSPSKTALLIDALGVPDGATIEQLCKVVGWQSHSVRAALTGLKKKGIVITRTKTDGKSVYAIASAPEPDASSPEVTA
ncbi:MAG: DUF3489 domain-containing protein [Hyphomicrobiaceae bacterium]|nr:DUF3489 domain-containing protein [Hyphomicrobiaceae bacterium]